MGDVRRAVRVPVPRGCGALGRSHFNGWNVRRAGAQVVTPAPRASERPRRRAGALPPGARRFLILRWRSGAPWPASSYYSGRFGRSTRRGGATFRARASLGHRGHDPLRRQPSGPPDRRAPEHLRGAQRAARRGRDCCPACRTSGYLRPAADGGVVERQAWAAGRWRWQAASERRSTDPGRRVCGRDPCRSDNAALARLARIGPEAE
jgi:hypothetical protein